MFSKLSIAAAALAMGAATLAPAAPAAAQSRYDRSYQGGGYDTGYQRGGYDDRRGYEDRRGYDSYRGDDRRYYNRAPRRCSTGSTGTILGAIAGGLLGRSIDTRGDRGIGTLLGAAGGAVAGHAIEKGDSRNCRR